MFMCNRVGQYFKYRVLESTQINYSITAQLQFDQF